jgi:hypothetical protein
VSTPSLKQIQLPQVKFSLKKSLVKKIVTCKFGLKEKGLLLKKVSLFQNYFQGVFFQEQEQAFSLQPSIDQF